MPVNTIQQNIIPSEPQLADLLQFFKKDLMLDFNCHHIGTLQSFNTDKQTVSVTINYSKTFFQFNGTSNAYEPFLMNYPVIAEAPVFILGGGSTALTPPLAAGDECMILFNDRDLDNWFTGGSGSPTATARLHSFADAVVIVGLRSLANVLKNYDPVRLMMRAGTSAGSITAVAVNPSNSKILLTNTYPSNSTTLNTLLQDLVTEIKNLVNATSSITVGPGTFMAPPGVSGGPVTGTSGSPLNASTISAIANDLTTTANQIMGLLE